MNEIELNLSQQAVVHKVNGPVMIFACAGSGKTRTLMAKIIYLIEKMQLHPWQILLLTFSRKAALEAKERILGQIRGPSPIIKTFHSFCAQILRYEYLPLGLAKNFHILDQPQSEHIIANHLLLNRLKKEISPIRIYIDQLKNGGYYLNRAKYFTTSGANKYNSAGILSTLIPKNLRPLIRNHQLFSIFKSYEEELIKSNAVDFGGLITNVLKLFETNPQILKNYQGLFKYILVDEYQDTNRAQFDLILHLAAVHRNICVVGDDDQSIYGWRGACSQNIADFYKFFPDTTIFKLEENYRSTSHIINGAASLISRNFFRSNKQIWTNNHPGPLIVIVECEDNYAEANFVALEINKIHANGTPWNEIAVFYRNHNLAIDIEVALQKNEIPYLIKNRTENNEKEIKELIKENNDNENSSIPENISAVSLMTVHSAKGLEFPYILLVGAEEKIFPSFQSLETVLSIPAIHALEEERRLFYVAITRAMKKIYISHALCRQTNTYTRFSSPSRFIFEIPNRFLCHRYFTGTPVDNIPEAKNNIEALPHFSYVIHPIYGAGVINNQKREMSIKVSKKIKANVENKVEVNFANGIQREVPLSELFQRVI